MVVPDVYHILRAVSWRDDTPSWYREILSFTCWLRVMLITLVTTYVMSTVWCCGKAVVVVGGGGGGGVVLLLFSHQVTAIATGLRHAGYVLQDVFNFFQLIFYYHRETSFSVYLWFIIKIKLHSSCEIEYFVETHLCKLCVILRSRVLRVMCPH